MISIRRRMRVPGAARATMYERPSAFAGRSTSLTPMLFGGTTGVAAAEPATGTKRAASDAAMIRRPRTISSGAGQATECVIVAE